MWTGIFVTTLLSVREKRKGRTFLVHRCRENKPQRCVDKTDQDISKECCLTGYQPVSVVNSGTQFSR